MARNLVILLGSNIQPEFHIFRAVELVSKLFPIVKKSSIWETEPIRNTGANFLNMALMIRTEQPIDDIHQKLRQIETSLGRVRTADKYASRTMDIDIIVDGSCVLDDKLWQFAFVAVPVEQLLPDLRHPDLGWTLHEISRELKKTSRVSENTGSTE
jgi:2-amino-4-hydroxy-6-hydroxymethyldihydropteridine diphosphokinase